MISRARVLLLSLALGAVVAVPSTAAAEVARTFVEPLEYGTDELHDPLDYAEPTDLMTDKDVTSGVDTFRQEDGLVRFRALGPRGNDWYVSPVWMTFPHHVDPAAPDSALPDADGGALHDQHDGLALPIDTSTYTHIQLRFHVSKDPGQVYLSWFTCQEWLPQCQGMMDLNKELPNGMSLRAGWNTVTVPISNNVPSWYGLDEQWTGEVHGVRLQGVVDAEMTVALDHVRLFQGRDEHLVPVTPTYDHYLYSDDATPEFSNERLTDETWGRLRIESNGSWHVNTGGLPPGTWYLFDRDGVPVGTVVVQPRPRPEVLDPDMAGGVDYATEVLGNPWDFEDRGDFVRVGNSSGVGIVDGELTGKAAVTSAAPRGNDPYVVMPLGPDGLDPVHYHRVTVDQHYDDTFNLDDGNGSNNPEPGGSHGRLVWRTPRHVSTPADCRYYSDGREFVFYKTWERYSYDMTEIPAAQGMTSSAEPNVDVPGCAGPDPHWAANGPISFLRFDPHEAPDDYRWYVDELRIAADDAADPTFDVTWTEHRWGSGMRPRVTVRLDTNRAGHDGEVLYDGPQTARTQKVTFDATDRLPGTYWVSITSTVNGRTSRDYATGPLQVSPRISGQDRVATAVEMSRQSFDTARTAIVASSESFPDALVAVQLADAVEGPVLLTPSDGLDHRVRDELERLGVREVVMTGGGVALSGRVERQLENNVATVTRIGGATRYETAAELAREALARRGTSRAARVLVTTGANFPDALAAGPYVGYSDTPLVLARPALQHPPGPDGTVPPPTVPADNDAARDFLADVGAERATVLGGPVALGPEVVDHVAAGRPVDRIAGPDRFATARKLTQGAVDAGGSPARVLVATGRNYPDALSAGPAALARGAVLVLTEKDGVPAPTRTWLASVGSWQSWRVVGGPVAISHATVRDLRQVSGL